MNMLPRLAPCFLPLALAACGGAGDGKPAAVDATAATAACAACHVMDQSAGRRSGPALYGIMGKTAGTQPGYAYSPAMKNSGIVWTPETLDAFLASPQGVVPGTRMGASGISDPARRKAIIAALAAK